MSAGEHLPSATWDAWREATGLRIIDGIGATEMLHIFISASGDDIRPGATGRPVPGFRARVVDEDGQAAPDERVGRLQVRGPVGCRYLCDDRQLEYVQDGWNVTGDSYMRDADGYYWYQARTDDMIISSGYNIAGPEVESALLRHADVAEAAVVGVPDRSAASSSRHTSCWRRGWRWTDDSARASRTSSSRRSRRTSTRGSSNSSTTLPRTSTGKLQRFRLREQG